MSGLSSDEVLAYVGLSGCSDIHAALEDMIASGAELDPSMLNWIANFVATSPPDTQAAPKGNAVPTNVPQVDDGGYGGGGKGSDFEM